MNQNCVQISKYDWLCLPVNRSHVAFIACMSNITLAPPDMCNKDRCFPYVDCIETPGQGLGWKCGPCPPGFQGDGTTCQDIDEVITI